MFCIDISNVLYRDKLDEHRKGKAIMDFPFNILIQ